LDDWSHSGKNVLFVTTDDKVYAFGDNSNDVCGFGHNSKVNEPEQVTELEGKGVCKFISQGWFVIAQTSDQKVFGWGYGKWGQLAARVDQTYSRPVEIPLFAGLSVAQMLCGWHHTIALTSDHKVLGWGSNYNGQVGCGKKFGYNVYDIQNITYLFGQEIDAIYCSNDLSFAITSHGLVYSWGYNYYGLLGHQDLKAIYRPQLVNQLSAVKAICATTNNTYMLTTDGLIHVCGVIDRRYQWKLTTIDTQDNAKFLYIYAPVSIGYDKSTVRPVMAQGVKKVYKIECKSITQATANKTIDNYILDKLKITNGTKDIKKSQANDSSMSGIDSTRFVGMPQHLEDELTCGICLKIFSKPVVTPCCQQTFCEACIKQWLDCNGYCPNDRSDLSSDYLIAGPKNITNILGKSIIHCRFQDLGCPHICELDFEDSHVRSDCIYNPDRKCSDCGGLKNSLNSGAHNCIQTLSYSLSSIMTSAGISGQSLIAVTSNEELVRQVQLQANHITLLNSRIDLLSDTVARLQTLISQLRFVCFCNTDH